MRFMAMLTMLPLAHKNRNASPTTQMKIGGIEATAGRGTFGSLLTHPSDHDAPSTALKTFVTPVDWRGSTLTRPNPLAVCAAHQPHLWLHRPGYPLPRIEAEE